MAQELRKPNGLYGKIIEGSKKQTARTTLRVIEKDDRSKSAPNAPPGRLRRSPDGEHVAAVEIKAINSSLTAPSGTGPRASEQRKRLPPSKIRPDQSRRKRFLAKNDSKKPPTTMRQRFFVKQNSLFRTGYKLGLTPTTPLWTSCQSPHNLTKLASGKLGALQGITHVLT